MAVARMARFQLALIKTRVMCGPVRSLSTSPKYGANHYDVLGITPKATQGDIKAAYYKLSKIYHPDKSDDETSARKFRAITEAYEVLGNVKLKKMYDRGFTVGRENTSRMDFKPEPEPTDPTLRFYKSRDNRNVTPTMDGRRPIYDFDTWSKQHYGDLFEKQQYEKELLRKKRSKQTDRVKSDKQEAIIYIMFLVGGLFFVLVTHGTEDYDKDNLQKKHSQEKQSTKD